MTYACPAWEFAADNHLLKFLRLQNKFSAPLEIFQGAHLFANCTWLSNFRIYTIIWQSYPGNKWKSYKIMKMKMFAILDKANCDRKYKGLKLGGGQTYDRSSD
jgi:hypothetical protein